MKRFFRQLYLTTFTFYVLGGVAALFAFAFFFPRLYLAAQFAFFVYIGLILLDIVLLFRTREGVTGERTLPEKFSNGDENPVTVKLVSRYPFTVKVRVIDELPEQFQLRDFGITRTVDGMAQDTFRYYLRPVKRGEYSFGVLNLMVTSPLRFAIRRFQSDADAMVPVYPSFIQLRKYDLMAFSNQLVQYGIKRIRKLGHTMEFEQIKEYVQGDDIRTLNWKATAKKNSLMVNQFQDEKSQTVYMVIDKGRQMQMPFNGLSLLDYAINASLVLSNVILKKHDRAGLFSFSKTVENRVAAEKRSSQMERILEALYAVKTDFFESDFGRLYADIKRNVNHRSLVMLYTNFDTLDGLNRQLPYLRGIAKNHLLVVVFFHNTELDRMSKEKAGNVQEIYDKVIAEKFIFEKKRIVTELKKYGIHSVLTFPEQLTLDTINKYLEIKARGIL